MVGAEAHRQLEEQEALTLGERLAHLAAERLVAGSTDSMQRSSGSLRRQHTDPVHRSIEHIERSSQCCYWLLEVLE